MTTPWKPGPDEHLAIVVALASITKHFTAIKCHPKIATVAVKMWLRMTNDVLMQEHRNETQEEAEVRLVREVEQLWDETPDQIGAPV